MEEDFLLACERDSDTVVQQFLSRGDARSFIGAGALHLCASHDSLKAMSALLATSGGGVGSRDSRGDTPLHVAARMDRLHALEVLTREKDGDLNAKGQWDWTPLHHAAHRGHTEMVEWLLNNGADPQARDKDGDSPLEWAALHGHTAAAETLARFGARLGRTMKVEDWCLGDDCRALLMRVQKGEYDEEARSNKERIWAARAGTEASGPLEWNEEEISLAEITIGERLDEESEGIAKVARRGRYRGNDVCVLEIQTLPHMERGLLAEENKVLGVLGRNPFLVHYYGYALSDDGRTLYLILEMVAEAMQEISGSGWRHGNLAARNVLIRSSSGGGPGGVSVALSDYGLMREYRGEFHVFSNRPGHSNSDFPIRWIAPEVFTKNRWTDKNDVWAFGVLMWEVFSGGAVPYQDLGSSDIETLLGNGGRLEPPESCPQCVYALMQACWEKGLKKRPSFGDICDQIRMICKEEPFEGLSLDFS